MKLLKVLVLVMAILIAAGLGLLGWGLTHNMGHKPAVPPAVVTALPVPPATAAAGAALPVAPYHVDVALPAGARVEQMAVTADRVILRLSGAAGPSLLVLDPVSGRVAGRVVLRQAAP
ncbi:hypothetical protein GALL_302110 [mine drainage metagenome]|uniref:Uncharacterized protein n=1 Tax=mine drainage metagenome TaxID=410659 RepID=A0A1J5R790_9ZZZZ